jgi:hypothetical protein
MFPSFFNFAPSRLTRQKEEKKAKSAERDVKSFLKMLSSEKSSLFVHTHNFSRPPSKTSSKQASQGFTNRKRRADARGSWK